MGAYRGKGAEPWWRRWNQRSRPGGRAQGGSRKAVRKGGLGEPPVVSSVLMGRGGGTPRVSDHRQGRRQIPGCRGSRRELEGRK